MDSSSWCTWSSWSRCSAEPCRPGLVTKVSASRNPGYRYCLNRIAPFWSDMTISHLLANGSVIGQEHPNLRRTRSCDCRVSFLRRVMNGIFRKNCKSGWEETNCSSCLRESSVYVTAFGGKNATLPYCKTAEEQSASRLYRIVGGTVGAVAFLVLLLCFIRYLMGSRCRRRYRARQRCPPGLMESLGTTHLSGSPLATDRPPSYKDIVYIPNMSERGRVVDTVLTPTVPHTERIYVNLPAAPTHTVEVLPPSYQEVLQLMQSPPIPMNDPPPTIDVDTPGHDNLLNVPPP